MSDIIPILTYGKMQLDSAIDETTKEPLYPSIILSNIDYNLNQDIINVYELDETLLKYAGTEIIGFLKMIDTTFITRCESAQAQAKASGSLSDPVDFYYPAFDEQYSFGFRFVFGGSNRITFQCAVNLRTKQYDNSYFTGGYKFNVAATLLGEYSGIYDLFNTTESLKIYICINPYNDNSEGLVSFIKYITDEDSLLTPTYRVTGSGGKNNVKEIITRIFRSPSKDPQEVIIGGHDFVGVNIPDDIGDPDLPTSSILIGFHNMYLLDPTQLLGVSKALWSTDFFDNFFKLFNDPMEAIVSLNLSPVKPDVSDTLTHIAVGNIDLKYKVATELNPTYCLGKKLTNQYKVCECGTIILYEDYGSYIDYNSKIEIFLPFIGVQSLSVDDVMDAKLTLKYNIDFFTGDCIAYLHCYRPGGINSPLYQWKGNILSNFPISSANYSRTILTGINAGIGLIAGGTGMALATLGSAIGGLKPDIRKSNDVGSSAGSLGIFDPYIIVTALIEDKPHTYKKIKGLPSNTDISIEQGSGLIIADEIHIKGINATEEEKNELENLFKSGVIL